MVEGAAWKLIIRPQGNWQQGENVTTCSQHSGSFTYQTMDLLLGDPWERRPIPDKEVASMNYQFIKPSKVTITLPGVNFLLLLMNKKPSLKTWLHSVFEQNSFLETEVQFYSFLTRFIYLERICADAYLCVVGKLTILRLNGKIKRHRKKKEEIFLLRKWRDGSQACQRWQVTLERVISKIYTTHNKKSHGSKLKNGNLPLTPPPVHSDQLSYFPCPSNNCYYFWGGFQNFSVHIQAKANKSMYLFVHSTNYQLFRQKTNVDSCPQKITFQLEETNNNQWT